MNRCGESNKVKEALFCLMMTMPVCTNITPYSSFAIFVTKAKYHVIGMPYPFYQRHFRPLEHHLSIGEA